MSGSARLRPAARFLLLLWAIAGIGAFPAVPASAAGISPEGYRGRLIEIRSRLEGGDWVGAGLGAHGLLEERVAWSAGELATDASVLGPIARATTLAEARGPGGAHVRRLRRLIEEWAAVGAGSVAENDSPKIAADHALLERLRARDKLADLPGGGALPRPKPSEGVLGALGDFFAPLDRALRTLGRKILEWLERMFTAERQEGGAASVSSLAIGIAILIALGLSGAAILYVRRRRKGGVSGRWEEAPTPPAADDDPLSREESEWERYARELERAGRPREAVRAWYHAVLVALYRSGFVHYRRGRTNWEYVASLAPSLSVRPGFADLTRRFEREWYGRDESSSEALAAVAEEAGELLGAVRALARSAA